MNAVFAGFFTVLLRMALRKVPDAEVATFVIAVIGTVIAVAAAVIFGASLDEVTLSELWPFIVVGALAPGLGQLLYVHAVRTAGASRPAIVVAVAPLISAVLAVAFIGESLGPALALGTVLIVAGGATIAWDGGRPADLKRIGIILALVSAVFFSARDVIVRWASDETIVSPQVAMATAFASAVIAISIYLILSRGVLRAREQRSTDVSPLPRCRLCARNRATRHLRGARARSGHSRRSARGHTRSMGSDVLDRSPATVRSHWSTCRLRGSSRSRRRHPDRRVSNRGRRGFSGLHPDTVDRDHARRIRRATDAASRLASYRDAPAETPATLTATNRAMSSSESKTNGASSSDISAPTIPKTHHLTRHERRSGGISGSEQIR